MERKTCKYKNLCKINYVNDYNVFDKISLLPCCNSNIVKNKELFFDSTEFASNPKFFIDKISTFDCSDFTQKCNGCIGEIKNVEVSLSRKCNTKCKMCGFEHVSNESQEVIYKTTLKNLKGNNYNNLTLTCEGEPFVYDWTYEYLESLSINDFKNVYIISNGILIDNDKLVHLVNTLNSNSIKLHLIISIHSFNERTYAKIMRHKYFNKVIETTILAYKLNILECINYVIQHDNFNEYIFAKRDADLIENGLGDKICFLLNFCQYSLNDLDENIAKQIDNYN